MTSNFFLVDTPHLCHSFIILAVIDTQDHQCELMNPKWAL